jgi:hypothetical protein
LTVTSPFDATVGLHLLEIDCSNDTGDAGFWAVGSTYEVRLSTATTVDSLSVSGYGIGEFRIQAKADLDDLNDFNPTTDTVANVTTVATTTTNSDMRGTDGAATSSQATSISSQISGLNDLSSSDISTAVWQVSLATYGGVGGSTGKAFKQLREGIVSAEGLVDDAIPTASSFVTTLTGPDANFFADKILVFTSGNLTGQARIIATYNESTQEVTFDEPYTRAPADTDEFVLLAIHQHTLKQINDQVVDVVNTDTLVAGQTVAESLRRIGAITSGKVSGAGSGSEVFKDYAESANSITITVDTSGNRTAVSY